MKRKVVSGIMLTLLSISILVLAFNIQPVEAGPKTIYVDDDNTSGPWDGTIGHPYQYVTSGLEHASSGDTIFVCNGTYYEEIIVDRTVLLIGENRNTTVIDGNKTGTIIDLVSGLNGAAIAGFTIQNGWEGVRGFRLSSCRIVNNDIMNCSVGMHVWGNNLSVNHNKITNCGFGLGLGGISNSTIIGNFIANNTDGFYFGGANNTFRSNEMIDNYYNFGHMSFTGGYNEDIAFYINDIDTSNSINGKPIYYWINQQGKKVPADAAYVELVNCTDITVRNLSLSNNLASIILFCCQNCTLENVHISHSVYYTIVIANNSSDNIVKKNYVKLDPFPTTSGLLLSFSENNSILLNTMTGSNNGMGLWLLCAENNYILENDIVGFDIGVLLMSARNNTFHHNNFINNTKQVSKNDWRFISANTWDDGFPSGGNYWSDYEERYPNATEIDGSGVWDTPYVIDENNQDNYPLMEPWTPTPPIPTTIDELKTEIEELYSEGEIDNQGIVRSLLAKLNTAQKLIDNGKIDQAKNILEAFINQVQAQSAKHITPEAADTLIKSAEYILSLL